MRLVVAIIILTFFAHWHIYFDAVIIICIINQRWLNFNRLLAFLISFWYGWLLFQIHHIIILVDLSKTTLILSVLLYFLIIGWRIVEILTQEMCRGAQTIKRLLDASNWFLIFWHIHQQLVVHRLLLKVVFLIFAQFFELRKSCGLRLEAFLHLIRYFAKYLLLL